MAILEDRVTYLTVAKEASQRQYTEFFGAIADALTQVSGVPVMVHDLVPRVADPAGLLGQDDEGRMATFLSMPLRAGGRVVGCLALSSGTKNAFGEASLNTLRLVEQGGSVVISNGRQSAAHA